MREKRKKGRQTRNYNEERGTKEESRGLLIKKGTNDVESVKTTM